MIETTTSRVLARRLSLAGLTLMAGAAAAFVWAVGFTRGVDGLLEGLLVAGVGLFLPGVAMVWIGSIVDGAATLPARTDRGIPRTVAARQLWMEVARNYAIATVAVTVAALIRVWLSSQFGMLAPYATFVLAVALAAWIGGVGPGLFAAVASVFVAHGLVSTTPESSTTQIGEWIAAALFLTMNLAIAVITSALRVTRLANAGYRSELALRDVEHGEISARLGELADEIPQMRWWCAADGRCVYVNACWRSFHGPSLDDSLGAGWTRAIHPDDIAQWTTVFKRALKDRQALHYEYRRRRHDGAYRRVRDEAQPRVVGERTFIGLFGRTVEIESIDE